MWPVIQVSSGYRDSVAIRSTKVVVCNCEVVARECCRAVPHSIDGLGVCFF